MIIRRAEPKDIDGLDRLLYQVAGVHQKGRPDLFKTEAKKYTDEELLAILDDDMRPVFVGVDENDYVMGYAFCLLVDHTKDHAMTDILSLYIDDLCVDETLRGQHIGRQIYEYVLGFAREKGCYNVTLNVWSCNEKAMGFYQRMGLRPQKVGMEVIL